MRNFIASVFGILAVAVFFFALGLFFLSEMLEPPKRVVIRPGVERTVW